MKQSIVLCYVAVPVQLVDMCQLDLASNWTTTSDPDHSSNVLSKEAKVLGKHAPTCALPNPHLFRFCRGLMTRYNCVVDV